MPSSCAARRPHAFEHDAVPHRSFTFYQPPTSASERDIAAWHGAIAGPSTLSFRAIDERGRGRSRMHAVGVMFDYFAAATDDEAAAVIDRLGGPGASAPAPRPQKTRRPLFNRKSAAMEPVADDAAARVEYDTISGKGIDPVVQLGTLEELLTGRSFDDVLADPRTGHDIAIRDEGQLVVVTLNDSISSTLANTDDATLERASVPWSETEEFWNAADPSDLAEFLKELAGLSRRAGTAGNRLYCWICV